MANKSSESSRPVRLKSMNSRDIANRQLTDRDHETIRRIASRQASGDDSLINLKDIPRVTDQQLAAMLRLRDVRPRKVAVSLGLDARVPEWLKAKGGGHLTRINDTLANVMDAEQRVDRRN